MPEHSDQVLVNEWVWLESHMYFGCSILDGPKHYKHTKLLLVTSKGIMMSQVMSMFLHQCALATVAPLETKATKKATCKTVSLPFKEGTVPVRSCYLGSVSGVPVAEYPLSLSRETRYITGPMNSGQYLFVGQILHE